MTVAGKANQKTFSVILKCYNTDTLMSLSGRAMKVELVTTLKRQATKILSELKANKEPVLITEHGKPSAYLLSVDDYELMQRRLAILEGIARGERAITEEKLVSHHDAKEQMSRWLK